MTTTLRSMTIALASLMLSACGDGEGGRTSTVRIPSEGELVGTYDLATTFGVERSAQPVRGVGTVSTGVRLTLSVPYVDLQGPLLADGTATLRGMTLGSDAIQFVHGVAHVEEAAGVFRISGSVDGPSGNPATFVMERPVGADVSDASARYLLTFDRRHGSCECETTVDLDVTVAAGGTGTAADALEIETGGTDVFGALVDVLVQVSPSRRFTISARYGNPRGGPLCPGVPSIGGPCTLSLRGTLPAHPGEATAVDFSIQDGLTVQIDFGTVVLARVVDATRIVGERRSVR